ncbi:MAG: GTPase RsgA [Caldilineaceae bacterium]|nr:GTPase RsgA [Caldilineaceae bacterium]
MLDRFLVIAEANEPPVLLCVNKVELTGEDAARQSSASTSVSATRCSMPAPGAHGHRRAARGADGPHYRRHRPSGVGKSSLLNVIHRRCTCARATCATLWTRASTTTRRSSIICRLATRPTLPTRRVFASWGCTTSTRPTCSSTSARWPSFCTTAAIPAARTTTSRSARCGRRWRAGRSMRSGTRVICGCCMEKNRRGRRNGIGNGQLSTVNGQLLMVNWAVGRTDEVLMGELLIANC